MATKIEWATDSWNPITGCTPISEGCQNCYARRMATRFRGRFGYPQDDPFRVTFHPGRLGDPLHWKKPRRIFVCSMGDLFHKDVQLDWIDSVYEVMAACPQHIFQVLTKRPKNINWKLYSVNMDNPSRELGGGDYLPNVWLGVTVESNKYLWRIEELLKIPAAVRFVSVEPMLGAVNISRWLPDPPWEIPFKLDSDVLQWVICGGETGPGARPMHPDWARSLRDQCQAAGVPFFMKKMSGGSNPPDDLMIREYPKEKPLQAMKISL